MANWRLISLICEQGGMDKNSIAFHSKQAFKHFSFAFMHGQKVKSPDWVEGRLVFRLYNQGYQFTE